jgi:hypothetical protein
MRLNAVMTSTENKDLAEECASCFSEIVTRVQIIEELLVAESRDNRNNVVSSDTSEWQNAVTLAAKDLKNIANLHELELYNGQPFCWSDADNTLDFVIPVKRNRVTELTLNIVAVMKSECIIAMIIIVDGDVVKINAKEV